MRKVLLAVALVALIGIGYLVLNSGEAATPSLTGTPPGGGESATMSVAPVRSVITSAQDDVTLEYSVGNNSSRPRSYEITIGESSAEGRPLADGPRSAARWVSLGSSELTVSGGQRGKLPVRVRPPVDRGASERRITVTITDNTVDSAGNVNFRTAISTSVYVEGTGPVVRKATLSGLDLPLLSGRDLKISADLENRGTVITVPGAQKGTILGTASGTDQFLVSGDVVRPGEKVPLTGLVRTPIACWCEVRITAPDGTGVTTVSGRVLVLPWWWLLGALVFIVAAVLTVRRFRRPAGASPDRADIVDV